MVLDTNSSSVFKLRYKLVLVPKQGVYLKGDECINKLTEMSIAISKGFGIEIEDLEINDISIIFEFKAKPNTEISKFINAYKSAVSRKIKKECIGFENIKEFWSRGYLLLTLGEHNQDTVEKYIIGRNSRAERGYSNEF